MSIKISQINGCDLVDAELQNLFAEFKVDINKELTDVKSVISGLSVITPTEFNAFKTEFERWKTEHGDDATTEHNTLKQRIDTIDAAIETITNEYATQEWVESKNYLVANDVSEFATKSALSALNDRVSAIAGDDEALDTLTEVKEKLAEKVDTAVFTEYKSAVNSEFLEKAPLSELNALTERVTTLENSTADADALDAFKTETAENLAAKAPLEDFKAIKKIVNDNAYAITFADAAGTKEVYTADTATFDILVYPSNTFDDTTATKVSSSDDEFTAISKKGVTRFNGSGKLYFKPVPHDGYKITRVKVDDGEYGSISADTAGVYTVKNIRSDLSILVTCVLESTPAFSVSFVLEHGTVKAYSDSEFVTEFDDPSAISVEEENNVWFELIPDSGYAVSLTRDNILGSYKNLKVNADEKYGNDNMYAITKISSNVTVTPVFTRLEKTLADYAIIDAYTKDEIDAKVSSVYKYKGSVAKYENLPTENLTVGDVYNVEDVGLFKHDMNYAWNGEAWDALGSSVDLSSYSTTEQSDAKYATLDSVSAIQAKLPDVPAAEGTYTLQAVRTADGIAYSWVSVA